MHIGLCTISNGESPVDAVLEQAADVGYDGVEIWGKDHVGDGSAETCHAIRRQAADLGLEIPVYSSYLRPGTPSFPDELDRELSVADQLDADLVRVWAGDQEYDDHEPAHWDRVVDDLKQVTRAAGRRDLDVTVEKHAGTLTDTKEGARRLIETVDSPRCGLNYQAMFSLPPSELLAEAEALAPISNNVHVQAMPDQNGERRCPLADAYFDVEAVLQPFLEADFRGYVNVEFVPDDRPYREAIQEDLEYLRSVAR